MPLAIVSAKQDQRDVEGDTALFVDFLTYALLAFGGIALFVGAFIIFNTFSITIAQRTKGAVAPAHARREPPPGPAVGAGRDGHRRRRRGYLPGAALGIALGAGLLALFQALGAGLPVVGLVVGPGPLLVAPLVGLLVTLLGRPRAGDPGHPGRADRGAGRDPRRHRQARQGAAVFRRRAARRRRRDPQLRPARRPGQHQGPAAAPWPPAPLLLFVSTAMLAPLMVAAARSGARDPAADRRRLRRDRGRERPPPARSHGRHVGGADDRSRAGRVHGDLRQRGHEDDRPLVRPLPGGRLPDLEQLVRGHDGRRGRRPRRPRARDALRRSPRSGGTWPGSRTAAATRRSASSRRRSAGCIASSGTAARTPRSRRSAATACSSSGRSARNEHLRVGSRLTLTTPIGRRAAFTVKGIYHDEVLLPGLMLALPTYRDAFGQRDDSYVLASAGVRRERRDDPGGAAACARRLHRPEGGHPRVAARGEPPGRPERRDPVRRAAGAQHPDLGVRDREHAGPVGARARSASWASCGPSARAGARCGGWCATRASSPPGSAPPSAWCSASSWPGWSSGQSGRGSSSRRRSARSPSTPRSPRSWACSPRVLPARRAARTDVLVALAYE